jgi:DNA polymerase-1
MILIEREADLLDIFENCSEIALDIETTGLEVFENQIRLIQLATRTEVLVLDLFKTGIEPVKSFLKPILESTETLKLVQNGSFDLKWIKHHLEIDVNRVFDTFIAAKLLENHVQVVNDEEEKIKQPKGWFKLDAIAKRYADLDISKEEQLSDWSGVLTESQLNYAADDVKCLFPIFDEQLKRLKEGKLTKVAKLEFDAILPVAWQELSGMYLDFEEWVSNANESKIKADEAELKLLTELGKYIEQGALFGTPVINLGSHVQIQKYFRLAGVPMPDSTKEFELTPLKNKYPIVQWLLDYRGYTKAYGTFGESYGAFVNPVTGRIHPSVWQLGSVTGRMSVSDPNSAQIPKTKEHRSCFKAEKGNVLLSFDYAQEELRILADKSGDKAFRKLFLTGQDFHTATAATVYKKKIEDVTEEERWYSKRVNFGIAYSVSPQKLAKMLNIADFEAQMLINNWFNTFKGVKRWLDYRKILVVKEKEVRSASGRRCTYDFNEQHFKSKSQVQRYAGNFPIQATASDILKSALRRTYDVCKPYGKDVKLINVVHDELLFEIKKELIDELKPQIQKAMIEAGQEFVTNVEIKVDSMLSDVWYKQDEDDIVGELNA